VRSRNEIRKYFFNAGEMPAMAINNMFTGGFPKIKIYCSRLDKKFNMVL